MSSDRWLVNQAVVLSNKGESTTDTQNQLDESPGNDAGWGKKASPPKLHLCDSVYVIFLTWQSYRNGEQVSSCQGGG